MGGEPLQPDERDDLDAIARYQFALPSGVRFLPDTSLTALRSRSGRVDRVYDGDDRLCTLTTHGRLTLGTAGGSRLHGLDEAPANRVAIDDEAVPFVAEGRNVFAKFVLEADERTRPRDEVVVVDADDRPVAVGRAELSAAGMAAFERGMAVAVRHPLDG